MYTYKDMCDVQSCTNTSPDSPDRLPCLACRASHKLRTKAEKGPNSAGTLIFLFFPAGRLTGYNKQQRRRGDGNKAKAKAKAMQMEGGHRNLASGVTSIMQEAEEELKQSKAAAGEKPPTVSGRYFERLHWSRVVQGDPLPEVVLFPPPGQDILPEPRLSRTHRSAPDALLPVHLPILLFISYFLTNRTSLIIYLISN